MFIINNNAENISVIARLASKDDACFSNSNECHDCWNVTNNGLQNNIWLKSTVQNREISKSWKVEFPWWNTQIVKLTDKSFSFFQGYKRKRGYIVTQMPMKHTIVDFWRLVFDLELNAIIMLNNLTTDMVNLSHIKIIIINITGNVSFTVLLQFIYISHSLLLTIR